MQDARVLVIDDDEVLRDLICRRLERLGINPDRAEDGNAGINLLMERPYDLIVTDIFMPGANGLDVLRATKEKDPLIQVIVITGGATIEMALEALDMGAFMYLTKPFDHLRVFDHAVENALRYRELVAEVAGKPLAADVISTQVDEGVIAPEAWLRSPEPRQSIEQLPFPFMVVSHEGEEIYANRAAQELIGSAWETTIWSVEELQAALERRDSGKSVPIQIAGKPYQVHIMPMDAKPGKKGRISLAILPQKVTSIPVAAGGISPEQLSNPIRMLKEGLAWLYGRRLMVMEFKVLRALAQEVTKLEALLDAERVSNVEAQPATATPPATDDDFEFPEL